MRLYFSQPPCWACHLSVDTCDRCTTVRVENTSLGGRRLCVRHVLHLCHGLKMVGTLQHIPCGLPLACHGSQQSLVITCNHL